MSLGIDKKEVKMIIIFGVFGIIWSLLVMPWFSHSSWFLNMIPPFQYIIYNIGFLLATTALLGVPMSHFIHGGKVNAIDILRAGFATWIIFSLVFDMWQPPFAYDSMGNLLPTTGSSLSGASIDMAMGWLYSSIGITGYPLYFMTYYGTSILAVVLFAFLLKPGAFLKIFN